jgi:trimeric autotransporter adhesin
MNKSLLKIFLLVSICYSLSTRMEAQISLLRDINNAASTSGSFPSNLTVLGGFVYYSASDGVTGTELWRSNGTPAGTTQVKDINPGDGSSSPSQFTLIGSHIYFRANDGQNGIELWRTDGTAAGTVMVANINPGINSGSPNSFVVINSTTLYFTANDGTNGVELWKTDVTSLATSMVANINTGGNSSPQYITFVLGTTVYFSADDGTSGRELWKSDGTSINTVRVKDINAGSGSSSPSYLTLLGTIVYFAASDAAGDNELYSTNGTLAGTNLLMNINPVGSSFPSNLTLMGSAFYFSANDGGTWGNELWGSNGTTTQIVSELSGIAPFTNSSNPSNFKVVGSNLYFTATSNNNGTELYHTTGLGGFHTQININAAAGASSSPYGLTNIGGTLYFTADDGVKGYELWRYNNTTLALSPVVDILPNAGSSSPFGYTLMGSTVFFSADNGSGTELWTISTSGTGLTQVVDLIVGTGASNPLNFVYNGAGTTYFTADDGSSGTELWKTDGTLAGTVRVKDINATPAGSSSPSNLTMVGTTLYFMAYDGTDYELWRSDGTNAGTIQLDVNESVVGASSFPDQLFALNSTTLLFTADDGVNGDELWSCVNGGSPTLVENINPVGASSFPSGFKILGSFAYYSADDGINGTELWRISTTTPNAANNSLFSNINTTGAGVGSFPSNFFPFSTTHLYFSANNGTGNELWRTDGGTVSFVSDINTTTATAGSNPYPVAVLGTNILFTANNGLLGTELWKSDGTGAGTTMIKDITVGSLSSLINTPLVYVNFNSKLYFLANDVTNGFEMWSSDGTPAGTVLFKDINPGAANSVFSYPIVSGTSLFFIASDGTGSNIFVTDGVRTCATIMVPPYSTAQTAGATNLISIGSKMIFSMVAQGNDREPFILDPALVTLPANTAITTHPTAQTITVGSPVTFTVAATGTSLTYQWQKNSVDISGATNASYTIPVVASGDAAQYRCVVTGICGVVNSNQATLTVPAPAAQPTAQPTAFISSLVTTTSFTVSFTAASPSPNGYIALRLLGTIPPPAGDVPVDGVEYSVGNPIGSGGTTVAFVGNNLTTTFAQTGLTVNTSYSYAIFSANGSTGTYNYLTTSPLTGTVSTLVATPTAQPTALVFSSVGPESLTASFTAATGSPAGYLVIRKQGSAPANTSVPVGGTTYTIGNTIGDATVAYVGPLTTFNDSANGLVGEETFHYQVFAFNGSGATINYLTTAPLANSQLMLAWEPLTQPTALVFSNISATSFTVSFTAPPTTVEFVDGYLAIRKSGSSPTFVPQDGTVYAVGATAGDGIVAYAGAAVTFNQTLALAQYSYDVFSYNGSTGTINYLTTSLPLEGTLTADNTPPQITNETLAAINSPHNTTQLKVVAAVVENESSVAAGSVKVEYRSISSGGAFSAQQDMTLTAGKWEFLVPATANGDLGVEYKITATNSQGLSASLTSKAALSFSGDGLSFSYTPAAAGIPQTNYRIISIPLELTSKTVSSVLVDDLTASDKKNWRMFSHATSTNTYLELVSSSNIEAGKGYWFISKDAKTIDTGSGSTVSSTLTEPYTISLPNGWNLIGNPYNYNVLWSDVKTASNVTGVLDLVTYDGAYNASDDRLNKFEGAFVFVSSGTLSLKFPVTKNPNAGRVSSSAKIKNLNPIDQPNWEVALTLRNGDMVSTFGGVGMNEKASMAADEFDKFTLPRFQEYLEINHSKNFINIPYAQDIVPTRQNHEWEFKAETNIDGNNELIWDNSYFGNSQISLVLLDVEENISIDMKTVNSYSLRGKKSKSFRVFYGNKEFIDGKTAVSSLLVHSVSPNPTNGQTQIGFSLPGTEETTVQVRVLNMMGQPVAAVFNGSLPGGYNEVTWSGKDNLESKPAGGIYLVEIRALNQTRVAKLIIN